MHKFFTDKLHFDLVLWLVTSVEDFTWNISSTESRQPKGAFDWPNSEIRINTHKLCYKFLLAWFLNHLNFIYHKIFYSKQFCNIAIQPKQLIFRVYSILFFFRNTVTRACPKYNLQWYQFVCKIKWCRQNFRKLNWIPFFNFPLCYRKNDILQSTLSPESKKHNKQYD